MAAMRQLHAPDEAARAHVVAALAAALASNPRVAFAYLYGSFAEARAFRDIDVGVYLAGDATRDVDGVDAELLMSEQLSRLVGLPVDMRILNGAPPTFLFHVFHGSRLTCRNEQALADAMERTAQRYLDIEPVLRQATREAFAS